MIDDLSKTLLEILTDKTEDAVKKRGKLPPELAAVDVVFDHPSEEFAPTKTTIDAFLYDIREDLELRSNEPIIERKNGEVITHRPPLRVACSYLVTAWPVGGADLALQEQRLLSQVLQVFSRLPIIPDYFLQGSLKGQSPVLPMVTALVDPQKNLSEFWTALGSQLRPSLTVTATFSMPLLDPAKAKLVISEELFLGQRNAPDENDDFLSTKEEIIRVQTVPNTVGEISRFGIFGCVTDAVHAPVAKATVTLLELGLSAKTDSEGLYHFILKQPGKYTLRAQKGDRQSGPAHIDAKAGTETNLHLA